MLKSYGIYTILRMQSYDQMKTDIEISVVYYLFVPLYLFETLLDLLTWYFYQQQ